VCRRRNANNSRNQANKEVSKQRNAREKEGTEKLSTAPVFVAIENHGKRRFERKEVILTIQQQQ
jgi:hypothetical protein